VNNLRALIALAALVQFGCGDGGTIAVPCEAERCNTQCVADGNESGMCRVNDCVCRPRVDLPSGHMQAVTSGGAVHREGGNFQLDLSVAVPHAAQDQAGTVNVDLGIEAQNDPTRGL
jgi:hypothetical protein